VLWSYRSAGVNVLPRVANDQFAATSSRNVRPQQLLKGDLLFFATNKSDWRTIHHVAIYAGDGYMIHAPTTGDVVRISPIWWAEFFGATRVLDAVPAPAPGPTTAPPPVNPGQPPPPTNPTKQPTTPPTAPPTTTPPATKPPNEPPPTKTASPAPSGSSSTRPSNPTGVPSTGKSASPSASSRSASRSASASP